MKLSYNSPIILSFTLISLVELIMQTFLPNVQSLFSVSTFSIDSPITYFQLISHVIGHANWEHFLSNFSFILLLGPLIEEKYGSTKLISLILVTAFITGVLFVLFFDGIRLLGASGIVFMLIILSSFSSYKQGKIPLTFILVSIIFLGKEIFNSLEQNQISEFAHILGGLCGAVFGFYLAPPSATTPPKDNIHISLDKTENGINNN